jgi:hypothetical protein
MALGFRQMTGALDGQRWRPSRAGMHCQKPMDDEANERGRMEPISSKTQRWATLAKRAIHLVEVEIIAALAASNTPLSATDLARRVGTKLRDAQLIPHMRRLRRLEAIEVAVGRGGMRPLDVRYHLAPI